MEDIHLGEIGVDVGFEHVGRNRNEGKVGGQEAVYDSDDHGSDATVSDDEGADIPQRRPSESSRFDPTTVVPT